MAEMNTETFITEILNRPPIWMSKHPQHKHKYVVNRLWEEIKQCFPTYDVPTLRKKWKNLKDSYRKELKKNPPLRFGNTDLNDEDCTPQWKYFNLMTFLREEILPVDDEINLTDNEDLDTSTLFELQSSLAAPLSQPSKSEKTDSRKRKVKDYRGEFLEIERKKIRMLEKELKKSQTPDIEKTEDYYYLMSILPEMQKLSSIQKMRVRNKINQILMDEMVSNTLGHSSIDYESKPTRDMEISNTAMHHFHQMNP
ncbi:PREDICTED: uncharacterized protein LOC106125574 [Papilio xuthus]|uniref:Uncharacterized protein LOC106125574 n=1 Tax=Papilio xuthus TaxID=66420 RepID=A0AAJ7EI65_PAPXU|nr:PREDICTED: uncharacterized protein LOC106125574 [Papilio xuthus]XP_013178291.1 PREDICTED: uncharacterized protein LOC106125574 [Papilio xuthus]